MAKLELKNVKKNWDKQEVIHGVNLTIEDGEFIVFVGPSGCGKSTLLRMISGLETISEGTLTIGDKNMTKVSPSDRGIAMVFQSYALYPNMTVKSNLAYPLEMAKTPKAEVQKKVAEVSKTLHLNELLDRLPKALSGGQRQRVAIGRAIIRKPDIFLFDEPLSNLDAELRLKMRIEIAKLHDNIGATMVYVTHDQLEAMTLADRIVVLSNGQIEQVGTPLDIYNNPDNIFVAGFIGSPKINLLDAEVIHSSENKLQIRIPNLKLENIEFPIKNPVPTGTKITVGIRPEHIIDDQQSVCKNQIFSATVSFCEHLGHTSYLYLDIDQSEMFIVESRLADKIKEGETVSFAIDINKALLFTADGFRIR